MKKSLYIILGFFICQSSFSQEKEVIFLDAKLNNVDRYTITWKNNKRKSSISATRIIEIEKRIIIEYYVEFERDMNGKVVNEVKLYKAKRKLESDIIGDFWIEMVDFSRSGRRRGTITGRGFVSKIDTDNFTNSIFKGQWREFYLNGNLKKVIPYDDNGIINGIYEEYFEDGVLNKKINYVNGEIISVEHNIDLSNNLKHFSDKDYIKAYIEKDGIDELEGLYKCSAHIPIRGRNLRGTYKIAIVNSKKSGFTIPSNYIAYILEADCDACSDWEIGDVLAFFKETESGEYDIYWNHPNHPMKKKYKHRDFMYSINSNKNFGSTGYMQIFLTEAIAKSNKKLIFKIKSEFIKDLSPKPFYDDESVTLDRIWPKSDIDTSIFSNQESDSSKDTNITREEAIVLLKELKELLDLGILTEDEYNKRASQLKRILLED